MEQKSGKILFGKGELEGHRFHLRKDPRGGTIVVDASRLLFLNETGYDYAIAAVEGKSDDEVISLIRTKYRGAKPETIRLHYNDLKDKILSFIAEPDVSPIETFDFGEVEPFSHEPSAPYRIDLALTYRCNNACSHCYVPPERRGWDASRELSTTKWKQILDQLLEVSIPHVTFTGGEPTLRDDLVELVQYSEEIGIIAGLVSNGRRLTQSLVDNLVSAGLDYVQITLESHLPEIHDQMVGVKGAWNETIAGLKRFIATDIYTLTNTTLTQLNRPLITETIAYLAKLGQKEFAMNGLIYAGSGREVADKQAIPEEDLDDIVTDILAEASHHDMRLIWYSPTMYCHFDPTEYGLGPRRCSAAYSSLAIEPNGNVLPCQSYFEPLGNILQNPWDEIWNHPTAQALRGNKKLADKCLNCELLKKCGGGCPLFTEYKEICCHHNVGG
ncbi:MAG: radical SAM protein [Candidatus Thorarchaeota archaeon]